MKDSVQKLSEKKLRNLLSKLSISKINKIYYITRTWLSSKTGGSQMRQKQVVIYRKEGFDVRIVTPNFLTSDTILTDKVISLPYSFSKIYSLGERIGVLEDYLDPWAKSTIDYLKEIITKEDIIFCSSGGELATYKIGSLLKEKTGCKYIAHYRDPLDYAHINGKQVDNKFHIDRSKLEYRYIKNADAIYTSSNAIKENLLKKYDLKDKKIEVSYFGYIDQVELSEKKQRNYFNIAYAGSMSDTQQPEILSKATELIENKQKIRLEYIGNSLKYEPLKENEYTKLSGPFAHSEFVRYMIENVDIGFVSLKNDYLGACVPSKIYEYINLGLPIIGALPDGDAKELIESNGFGFCNHYSDLEGIANSIVKLTSTDGLYEKIRGNILKQRDSWSMQNRMQGIIQDLRKIGA
jgi:glycosyltransferase involved in cell wall biosynthesis